MTRRRLVDLPGYGFARVSRAIKANWQALMGRYLEQRRCLRGLVVVMDIRHPLTEFDRQMIAWGVAAGRPMLLLLTKADKLGRGAAQDRVAQVRRSVADAGAPILVQAFSATSRLGLDQAQGQLSQWLELPPLA
jgi:GTP-binding protein